MKDETREALEDLEVRQMLTEERLEETAKSRLRLLRQEHGNVWVYAYAAPCGRTFELRRRVKRVKIGAVGAVEVVEKAEWSRDGQRIDHEPTVALLEKARQEVI